MDTHEYLIKSALLGTVMNPLGHVATRMMSDEGDPNAFKTGERGAWSGVGHGILGTLAGGTAGRGLGSLANVASTSLTGRQLPYAAATGSNLGSALGGWGGIAYGAKRHAYKKPAEGEKKPAAKEEKKK